MRIQRELAKQALGTSGLGKSGVSILVDDRLGLLDEEDEDADESGRILLSSQESSSSADSGTSFGLSLGSKGLPSAVLKKRSFDSGEDDEDWIPGSSGDLMEAVSTCLRPIAQA